MRPEEVNAFGQLAGDAARATSSRLHEAHTGIADRVWRGLGPASRPLKFAHDMVAAGAYAAAGEVSRVVIRAGAAAASLAAPREGSSIEDTVAGRGVVGVLNGAFGDALHQRGNRLALAMTLRQGGRDVPPVASALRGAYLQATPRLAVFVHGLGRTDDAWLARRSGHEPYGDRLRAELGYTPLYVRYNTGRHISENGRELAALLSRVTAAWPVEVREIVLVGHSVGGLVARSACHYGAGSVWAGRVSHLFTLGSPHTGSPVERLAGSAGAVLAKLPETRALASALNVRSAGIKDLAHGYLVDEDWTSQDRAALPPAGEAHHVPFLPDVEHLFISTAPHRRLGGPLHLDLLSDPAVYEQIRSRLTPRRELPAPRPRLPAPDEGDQRP
jgi:triacylglycerol esterase/lipase EstA (alpha/beta hydrolase family)